SRPPNQSIATTDSLSTPTWRGHPFAGIALKHKDNGFVWGQVQVLVAELQYFILHGGRAKISSARTIRWYMSWSMRCGCCTARCAAGRHLSIMGAIKKSSSLS